MDHEKRQMELKEIEETQKRQMEEKKEARIAEME